MGTAVVVLAAWFVLAVVFAAVHYRWVHYEAPTGRREAPSPPDRVPAGFAMPRFAAALAEGRLTEDPLADARSAGAGLAAARLEAAGLLAGPELAWIPPDSRERAELLSYFLSFDRN